MNAARRAFGERLRRQRERQKVSLETIARTTKVTAALFAGLERGDCRRWPGGVYSRSFIRAYAEAVKLDPDQTAAEFAELYDLPDAPESPDPQPIRTGPPLRLTLEADPVEYLVAHVPAGCRRPRRSRRGRRTGCRGVPGGRLAILDLRIGRQHRVADRHPGVRGLLAVEGAGGLPSGPAGAARNGPAARRHLSQQGRQHDRLV